MTRIAVAIPCYNGVKYVAHAIESVLTQSYPADQILVVDDGSADDSAAMIRQYPVTIVAHSENQGLAAARNTALKHVSAEIVAFMDADAVAAPDLLQVLLSGYQRPDPFLAGVGGQGIEVNRDTLADRWRWAHARQGYGARSRYVPFLPGLCMSFRVSILHQIGGFNTMFRTNAEDVDIGLRLNAAGFRLLYLPQARVFHQRQDDVASLKRTMMAWYRAAYCARKINNAHPWTLFAGTFRRLLSAPVGDLLLRRDPDMARLSISMNYAKLRALWQVARTNGSQIQRPSPER